MLAATYPRVRDACENCHSRKIRCLLEPGSIACQNCSTSGCSCLFAPRAKAGRPKRTHSENYQRRKLSSQAVQRSSKPTVDIGHNRSNSDPLLMIATDDLHFGTIIPFDSFWDHNKTADMADFTVDFLTNEHHMIPEEQETQTTVNETVQQDRTQQSGFGTTTPSRSSTPPPRYDIPTLADGSLEFDAALKLCGDLDRSYRGLRDGQAGMAELEGIMRTVEYACSTARISISSASGDKASTQALILAAMYKVFEICESLVRQIVGNEGDILDRLFRLQRLDLALLQGFMFIRHTGQVDALKRISDLHTWILSILQQQEYQKIW